MEYSFNKVGSISPQTTDLEELETWESFMARFSRSVDIFMAKYLRSRVLYEQPGFRGSLRDMLNKAEKFGWIDDVPKWVTLKEIRNQQEHEYSEENLGQIFKVAFQETPLLLSLKNLLIHETKS